MNQDGARIRYAMSGMDIYVFIGDKVVQEWIAQQLPYINNDDYIVAHQDDCITEVMGISTARPFHYDPPLIVGHLKINALFGDPVENYAVLQSCLNSASLEVLAIIRCDTGKDIVLGFSGVAFERQETTYDIGDPIPTTTLSFTALLWFSRVC